GREERWGAFRKRPGGGLDFAKVTGLKDPVEDPLEGARVPVYTTQHSLLLLLTRGA
ncbi:unnamed protein product, partial [Ixodes pacificus]